MIIFQEGFGLNGITREQGWLSYLCLLLYLVNKWSLLFMLLQLAREEELSNRSKKCSMPSGFNSVCCVLLSIVENIAHCEFAYLRDLLIRSVD